MVISERTSGNVFVLDLNGSITGGDGSTERLADKVRSVLQRGGKHLVLNLSQVGYVDSAGLGELVQSYSTVVKQGGHVRLSGVTERLNSLLVITKLSTVFESHDTEAAAIASLSRPS
jgi:anti-sigma B factor antagonist